jgi:hypothetical protein
MNDEISESAKAVQEVAKQQGLELRLRSSWEASLRES